MDPEAPAPAVDRTPTAPPTEAPAALSRLPLVIVADAIVIAFLLVIRPFAERLWNLRGANDWGSDFRWLQDGLDRLAHGLPLTRPAYVAGPWSQFAPNAEIPTYAWSLHPPYSAALYAPFLLAPADIRPVVWTAAMALAFGAAVWLAWPRRLWWATALGLLALMLWLPNVLGLGGVALSAIVDQIHYANPNALVMLGVAMVWLGRQRGSIALMAAGLVLAALKIAPAASLGVWLLVARRDPVTARWAIAAAVVFLVVVTVPILFLDPGAIGDLIRSPANLIPWSGSTNLSPQVWLTPIIGHSGALAVSYGIGAAMVLAILVGRLDGPGGLLLAATAPLLFTPQLWAHWFLIPAVALFATAGEWRVIRAVDERLRAAVGAPAREAFAT